MENNRKKRKYFYFRKDVWYNTYNEGVDGAIEEDVK